MNGEDKPDTRDKSLSDKNCGTRFVLEKRQK